jgi:RNA polymerase sigma-70 factor (ECF subfamily)
MSRIRNRWRTSSSPIPATQLDQKQRVDRLLIAITPLGERRRELFKWKLGGKSFPEIQKSMEQNSINTICT